MQKIKYILVFLIAAYVAQGCSLKAYGYCDYARGKKCIVKEASDFDVDHDDDQQRFKRKYKNKGIQVFLPYLAQFSIKYYKIRKEYVLPEVRNTATFNVEYVQCKRGPPSICS